MLCYFWHLRNYASSLSLGCREAVILLPLVLHDLELCDRSSSTVFCCVGKNGVVIIALFASIYAFERMLVASFMHPRRAIMRCIARQYCSLFILFVTHIDLYAYCSLCILFFMHIVLYAYCSLRILFFMHIVLYASMPCGSAQTWWDLISNRNVLCTALGSDKNSVHFLFKIALWFV